jgi:exonuclease SbcD
MVRFAHMADVHLGAFREPRLRQANLDAFLNALDICLAEKVDFILICGDLFHTSLPDMGVVEQAAGKLRQVIDAGMPVYVIYGSHDFSAAERSMVDVLHSAGVFVKVARASVSEEGAVRLETTVDERTGTIIAGISGRKLGLDKSYYEKLEAGNALEWAGARIFAFHAAITELKPKELAQMQEAMPVSLLPKGFDYYAGGHVHDRIQAELPGWGTVAYPGPLFGDGYRDLESGEPRGFYIVNVEKGKAPALSFREVPTRKTRVIEVDADGRAPEDVNADLKKKAEEAQVDEAIVLVKVKGELSTGKASDVDTEGLRKKLAQADAFVVYVNRGGLSTKERAMVRVESEEGRAEIEIKLLRENLANHSSKIKELKGEEGLLRARRLLQAMREEQKGGTNEDYDAGILRMTETILMEKLETTEKREKWDSADTSNQEQGPISSTIHSTKDNEDTKEETKPKDKASKKISHGKQLRLE